MTQWADYSAGRPSGAALKASGFGGAIRYIGLGSAGKRINAAEYRDLIASGVEVLLVAEQSTDDAWAAVDDYAQGRTFATAALNEARAIGIPDNIGIAAAADAHAVGSQITDSVAYVRGFRDVLGLARTGFYGFFETLNAVHAAGVASWYWRCGAEPNTQEQTWIHFWQRNYGETVRYVSGIQCDVNDQYHPVTGANPVTPEQDAILRQILNQLVGPWPSYVDPNVKLTLVDFARAIDQHTYAPAAPASVALTAADLDTLAGKVATRLASLQFKATP